MDIHDKARFASSIKENLYHKEMMEELRIRYQTALESSPLDDENRMKLYIAKLQGLKDIEAIIEEPINIVKRQTKDN